MQLQMELVDFLVIFFSLVFYFCSKKIIIPRSKFGYTYWFFFHTFFLRKLLISVDIAANVEVTD